MTRWHAGCGHAKRRLTTCPVYRMPLVQVERLTGSRIQTLLQGQHYELSKGFAVRLWRHRQLGLAEACLPEVSVFQSPWRACVGPVLRVWWPVRVSEGRLPYRWCCDSSRAPCIFKRSSDAVSTDLMNSSHEINMVLTDAARRTMHRV